MQSTWPFAARRIDLPRKEYWRLNLSHGAAHLTAHEDRSLFLPATGDYTMNAVSESIILSRSNS